MSANYTYNLFFRKEDMHSSYQAVKNLVVSEEKETFPAVDDSWISDQGFTYRFEADKCILDFLSTVTRPEGKTAEDDLIDICGKKFAKIGSLFTYFHAGNNYIQWAFTAPTTNMSMLLRDSPRIRQTFQSVLDAGNGLLGCLDVEDAVKLLPDFGDEIFPDEDLSIEIFQGLHEAENSIFDGYIEQIIKLAQ